VQVDPTDWDEQASSRGCGLDCDSDWSPAGRLALYCARAEGADITTAVTKKAAHTQIESFIRRLLAAPD